VVFALFTDILIIFTIALVVGIIFSHIRVPPLVAFILTGVIVGPYGFSIIQGQEEVKNPAGAGFIDLGTGK
jgi:CPA2 family monovalent cation:H+ antiporter-2